MDPKSLIDQTETVVLLIKNGIIVYANAYAKSFFGYKNLVGFPVVGTIVPAVDTSGNNLEKLVKNIEENHEQYRLHVNENITAEGRHVWLIWSNSQHETANKDKMLLSVGMEVTEIIRRQKNLEAAFTNSNDGIAFLNSDFKIIDYNTSFMNLIGFDSEEEMRKAREDVSSEYGKYLSEIIRGILDRLDTEESIRIQRDFTRHDGESFVVDGVFSKVRNIKGDVIGYVANLRDSTDMYKKATTDKLTKIFNRMHFEELAEHEIDISLRHKKQLSLILCDVDHFKNVNDTYGHLCGDIVLSDIASEIKRIIRGSDIFARVGGEEFAILLPDTNAIGAKYVAEKIRYSIEKMYFYCSEKEVKVTMSFGIAELNTDKQKAESLTDLFALADKGLYISKKHGRNRVTL